MPVYARLLQFIMALHLTIFDHASIKSIACERFWVQFVQIEWEFDKLGLGPEVQNLLQAGGIF